MTGHTANREIATRRIEGMQGVLENPVVLGTSTFMLGFITGLVLKGAATQAYERARRSLWHREYTHTVRYGENLPASLGRREPAPSPGQPRFGGTGALGLSPRAVDSTLGRLEKP
jgi:hypothetical protein